MFSYIKTLFVGSSEPGLSLEDCTKILKETQEVLEVSEDVKENSDVDSLINRLKETYSCDLKTGTITSLNTDGDKYLIDNMFEFDPEGKEYSVGQKVSYQRFLENGKFNVYNVNSITNDWDTQVDESSIWSKRLMVCKVEKREKRHLILSPGNVRVDLDKVSIEFIPLVGDWLELDVKYEVNEHSLDLSGKIIEVDKVSPVRPHIETCTVNNWTSYEGVLNKNIFFNKDAVSCGYIPRLGDKVIAEVIESDQSNNCIWRATKILPEYISNKFGKNKGLGMVKINDDHPGLEIADVTLTFTKLNESKQFSVEIKNISSQNFVLLETEFSNQNSQCKILDKFEHDKLSHTNNFTDIDKNSFKNDVIDISTSEMLNTTTASIKNVDNSLEKCEEKTTKENVEKYSKNVKESTSKINVQNEISSLKCDKNILSIMENSANEFKKNILKKNVVISPGKSFCLNCECIPRNMGTSSEFLLLSFDGFKVGKWVEIVVENSITQNSGKIDFYQRRAYNNKGFQYENNESQFVRGQRKNKARFQAVRIPSYPVSKKLMELVFQYDCGRDQTALIEQLKITKRALFTNLSALNYEEKFHTLLNLDEIHNLISIQDYDMDRTCFIRNGEFLMLEIENLAERRPSIVLGDRIIATDPLKLRPEEYEGNVFRVAAKHVYLKFSALFHDTYNGEDYSTRVIPGRAQYRRQHHAIFLAARNLGQDWLFPTKIVEKEQQVNFTFDPYPRIFKTEPNAKKKRTPNFKALSQSIRDAKEKKLNTTSDESDKDISSSSLVDMSEENLPKIQWFNKNLNCKQKDAVINILKGTARPLPYIIFGPPGTGKTVTVIEATLQIMKFLPESRLLVAAPSNSAADLIATRLIDSACLKPGVLVRLVSLNYGRGDHIPAKLIPFCATAGSAKEGTAGDDENIMGENGVLYDCSRAVLGRHKITVTTCSSAGSLYNLGFPRGHFTHIIVDESGQAGEPEVMIPVSFFDKWKGQVILAGDPMQLGPVVMSKIAAECGLQESLLERLINRFPYVRDLEGFPETEGYDPRLVTKLLYNYRSLGLILELFSSLFYNGDLIPTISPTDSPEAALLQSLAEILPLRSDGTVPSMVFHGVNGENYQSADSPSWFNPHEAAQVFYYVNEFYRLGLKEGNLGIITPYIKQVKEIKSLLNEAEFAVPKIGTVEDFQGQEYDVIILSTVRSSQNFIPTDLEHSLGFVSSPRRLNVAISRPKSLLVIVGNPNLLCFDTYWRTVITYCLQNGAYTGCDWNA